MNLSEAKDMARRISKDSKCVQHVNMMIDSDDDGKVEEIYYVVSYWSDTSTKVSYENGRLL